MPHIDSKSRVVCGGDLYAVAYYDEENNLKGFGLFSCRDLAYEITLDVIEIYQDERVDAAINSFLGLNPDCFSVFSNRHFVHNCREDLLRMGVDSESERERLIAKYHFGGGYTCEDFLVLRKDPKDAYFKEAIPEYLEKARKTGECSLATLSSNHVAPEIVKSVFDLDSPNKAHSITANCTSDFKGTAYFFDDYPYLISLYSDYRSGFCEITFRYDPDFVKKKCKYIRGKERRRAKNYEAASSAEVQMLEATLDLILDPLEDHFRELNDLLDWSFTSRGLSRSLKYIADSVPLRRKFLNKDFPKAYLAKILKGLEAYGDIQWLIKNRSKNYVVSYLGASDALVLQLDKFLYYYRDEYLSGFRGFKPNTESWMYSFILGENKSYEKYYKWSRRDCGDDEKAAEKLKNLASNQSKSVK